MDAPVLSLPNQLEAILMTAESALSLVQLGQFFPGQDGVAGPDAAALQAALDELSRRYQATSMELVQTGAGFRIQTRSAFSPWVLRHHEEKPQRYSRALLETLALIAWRQPITRGEIEAIRGVAVNSGIIRTLLERDWIRVLGHREVPGRPEMLGTTHGFLDHFSLRSLDELPGLDEIRSLPMDEPLSPLRVAMTDAAGEAEAGGD
ncbi:MAG: SMC-Scp complex subunit ScpB [Thiothrix sp.]|nr:SMC-Scp complex subunit ScpB [Thiothrix sp.]HPQ95090.1 SMC-Scp complex subunit ScpB [Thiolinea sp.]